MKEKKNPNFSFSKTNFKLMIFGLILIVTGFVLMIGGGSNDPNIFNPEIFSFRRITLSPIIILIGFVIQVIAILYKAKK